MVNVGKAERKDSGDRCFFYARVGGRAADSMNEKLVCGLVVPTRKDNVPVHSV